MGLLEDIQGSLLGCAIGDALGYPVEFRSDIMGGSKVVLDLPKNPLFTDDTQMTVAVTRGLLAFETGDEERDGGKNAPADYVKEELIKWADDPETPGRAPGTSCLYGCRRLKEGVEWMKAGKPDSAGCGAVMRSAPYGWFYRNRPERARDLAGLHALMTHLSPEAQGSAAALAAGVAVALDRPHVPPNLVVDHMYGAALHFDRHTATMIDFARRFVQWGVTPAQALDVFRGWTGHEAIAAAVYCFLTHPHSYGHAVLLAVNSPGDSDSLGAITGALSGAYLGLEEIPDVWVDRIEKRDMLLGLGVRVHQVARTGYERNHEPGPKERKSGPASTGGSRDSASPAPGGGTPSTPPGTGSGKPRGKIHLRSGSPAPRSGKP